MGDKRLQKLAENAKYDVSDVIDKLTALVDELEFKNATLEIKLSDAEDKIKQLEYDLQTIEKT